MDRERLELLKPIDFAMVKTLVELANDDPYKEVPQEELLDTFKKSLDKLYAPNKRVPLFVLENNLGTLVHTSMIHRAHYVHSTRAPLGRWLVRCAFTLSTIELIEEEKKKAAQAQRNCDQRGSKLLRSQPPLLLDS